jgi:hypothetical protein
MNSADEATRSWTARRKQERKRLTRRNSEGAKSKPVRLCAQKGMVEPTPELMQGIYRLFGRKMVALEGDA